MYLYNYLKNQYFNIIIDNMKLGLIGCGYWGTNLIREFNKLGVLKAICDTDVNSINKFKSLYTNLIITTDYNELLNDNEITAVCISLPAELHYDYAKRALLFDKDVFVEKPITLDVKEAEELVNLANRRNKILMVGHLLHYHPCIMTIKKMINEGKIGKIKNIVSNRLNLGKFRTSENVLFSFAPHDISVILSLCGNKLPTKALCCGKSFVTKNIHDITNSILYYDSDDIYININVNWLNPYKEQKLTIIGEKGMILFDDTLSSGKIKFYEKYIKWSDTVPTNPIPYKDEKVIEYEKTTPLEEECKYFINCCHNREEPITSGEEGIKVLKVLNKLTESLNKNGELVYFSDKKYFSHNTAIIDDGVKIGNGTKIWHFSHILKNCDIGENCNIGQNVFIAGDTNLGDFCKVQNNVSIYSGVYCEDHVFLGPSCVLTNDINPRCFHSKQGNYMKTYIETGATIGANSTIVCGNRIGKHSLIGAGAVVTKDVEPYSIVVGNPAKKIGTIDEYGNRQLEEH